MRESSRVAREASSSQRDLSSLQREVENSRGAREVLQVLARTLKASSEVSRVTVGACLPFAEEEILMTNYTKRVVFQEQKFKLLSLTR